MHRDRVGLPGRDLEEIELAEDAQLAHRILEHQLRLVGSGGSRLAKAGDAVGLELALAHRAAAFGAVEVDQRLDRGRVEQGAVAEPRDLGILGQRLLVGAVERRQLGDQLAVSTIAGEQPEQRQQRHRLRRRATAVGRLFA